MQHLTLCVLAAGMGSRYGGLKQIDPVGPHGETILDYSVYDACRAGFDRVVFIIRRDIEQDFRAAVGRRYEQRLSVEYAFQSLDQVPAGFVVPPDRRKPWGTAHAIAAAEGEVNGPFAVINADDFYGAQSYAVMASFLHVTRDDEKKAHYAMVGFPLRKTLSENGYVSRGVCTCDAYQYLQSIEEHTRIRPHGDAAIYQDDCGRERQLTGDEWVSMNLWGFTPSVFGHLNERFKCFLEKHGQEDASEFFIPQLIDDVMADGRADVRVLPASDARWFGVTYREDKPRVVQAIRTLIDQGVYPAAL